MRGPNTAGPEDSVVTAKRNKPAPPLQPEGQGFQNPLQDAEGFLPVTYKSYGGRLRTKILFDISDLVYYIGHHSNLTGIQRVQSSIVLSLLKGRILAPDRMLFLSFDAASQSWMSIGAGFLRGLLEDLFRPLEQRVVRFPEGPARHGVLPGATPFSGSGILEDGSASVLCLLGAAWVQRDYFRRVLLLKRKYGTKFVMAIHDLIPIYARETCDQGTAKVFEEFLRRALRHTDHFLSVSKSTAKDLVRYTRALRLPEPPVTVTGNGSSFKEFMSERDDASRFLDIPDRFVLFVSTIEGRKNHSLMLEIWKRLIEEEQDPPYLVCVGRLGWRSSAFISEMVESNYLNGRVMLLHDLSDADLRKLYSRCLFTVFPSLYEGWGLPVGESLAQGKICISSDRASIPEVAGDFGVYINIDDVDAAYDTVKKMAQDDAERQRLEARIRAEYKPLDWASIAERVVNGCIEASEKKWVDPYPNARVPYASEITFQRFERDAEGVVGDELLAAIKRRRKGYFLREPLDEVSFLTGEEARAGENWAEPEDWGTWTKYPGGTIVFGLGPSESLTLYVFLRLRLSAPLFGKTVTLKANGEQVWRGAIGEVAKDIFFPVQRRVAGPGDWHLEISAMVDREVDLERQVYEIDARGPGIGFERAIVIPEHDVKARLDILYSLLLDPAGMR
ncbi:MAG: glycosyltransferase family 4 protein [Alphaproteobacteria bacterium]|nr:glycosyltransferase family 4 protein [Alphaproteobacteria bacterium]